jgi:O-antigen/teichoic acid export membrane protein
MNIFIKKIKNRIESTNEINKTILNNALGAFTIKGGALVISLLTMPAYLLYFNEQQILGLWFTILSVLTWVLTFDLGIGNGLRNHLVSAFVANDSILAKRYISSAYFVIGILVLLVSFLSLILFRYINWTTVFNISTKSISNESLNITVSIVFVGITLQLLLKLITSILFAMQKSALPSLLSLISSTIILIYVLLAGSPDISKNLISLAFVHVLAVNIPLFVTTIIVFSTTRLKESKPSIKYLGKKHVSQVMKLGGIFFWVQIMYMIITTTNDFLITWLTGPEMVVEYQIYNKLFTLIGTLFTLGLTPIWSAVTKALTEKNYAWIKKLYNILKLMALLAIICEFAMILFLQFIIDLWLGNNAINVNYSYALVFAISGSILIWNGVLSTIANGFGKLKTQSVFFTIGAIIKIPIAWSLVSIFDSWIGVIIANIIAMSLYCIVQPIWIKNYLNKKIAGDERYV